MIVGLSQAGVKKKLADSSGVDSSQAEKDDPFIRYSRLDVPSQLSNADYIIDVHYCDRRETRPLNIWKTGANLESAKTREELKARVDKLKQEHPEGHLDIAALELKLQQLDQQSGAAKDGGADGKKAVVSGGQGAGAATDERTETWKDNDALLEEVRITVSDYLTVISINIIYMV